MHNLVQYVLKVPQVFETAQIGTEGSEESLRTALFSSIELRRMGKFVSRNVHPLR